MGNGKWEGKFCIKDDENSDNDFHDKRGVPYRTDFSSFTPDKDVQIKDIEQGALSDPQLYDWAKHNCYHSRKHLLKQIGFETPTLTDTIINAKFGAPVDSNFVDEALRKASKYALEKLFDESEDKK